MNSLMVFRTISPPPVISSVWSLCDCGYCTELKTAEVGDESHRRGVGMFTEGCVLRPGP